MERSLAHLSNGNPTSQKSRLRQAAYIKQHYLLYSFIKITDFNTEYKTSS